MSLFAYAWAGRLCANAVLLSPDDPESDSRPYIQCTVQNDTVGKKNVRLATGFYEVLFDTRTSKLSAACSHGYFGNASEYCAPCYSGAICAGGGRDPVSLAGFFIGSLALENRSDACQPEHASTRARCLAPRACDPPESCVGEDQCSEAYTSTFPLYRCATCAKGFYRLAGKCRRCPNNPWIMVVSFIVVVIVAAAVGYVCCIGVELCGVVEHAVGMRCESCV